MKQLILSLASLLLVLVNSYAQITLDTVPVNKYGLENLIVEKVPVDKADAASIDSLSEDAITYRIFADLMYDKDFEPQNEEQSQYYKFLGCGGTSWGDEMNITSTESFFNETVLGGMSGSGISPALFTAFPALKYDSYVSDGRMGNDNIAVPMSVNENGYIAISPETTPSADLQVPVELEVLLNNTSQVTTSLDGWVVMGGIRGPDTNNVVFIGQVTTAGTLNMRLHIAVIPLLSKNYKQITVLYPEVDTMPVVHISSPSNDAEFYVGETIVIKAEAIDGDGEIDSVEFFINGSKIGVDTISPYSIEWNPVAKGEYSITASATDDSLNTSVSSAVNVTINDKIIAIDNQFVEFEAEVYPNPANDNLFINYSQELINTSGTVNIYNMLGENMISREIKSTNINNTLELDISELKIGLYIVDLKIDNKRYMTKIIKK
jgi:hypothetical protein